MHSLLTWLACYSHTVGNLLKGHCRPLVSDGVVNHDNLRRSHLSEEDLFEEMRLNVNCDDLAKIKAAYKERSGEISAVRRSPTIRTFEISTEDGAKIVRIELMG